MRILFVCHGNICRSPMAEFIMKHLVKQAGLDWIISSAATSREELGNDIYPNAKAELKRHGIPLSSAYVRTLHGNAPANPLIFRSELLPLIEVEAS